MIAVSSLIVASVPPTKWRISGEMPCVGVGVEERVPAAARRPRLMCTWHELPAQSVRGLAMKVAIEALLPASSLTAVRNRKASSAAFSAEP